jgi:hypothetical protein
MAGPLKVQIEGGEAMIVKLRLLAKQFPQETARAADVVATHMLAMMVERTPKKTGALAASGRKTVSLATVAGAPNIRVTFTFGNSKVTYAKLIHEKLGLNHKNGQAKFAESVILEGQSTTGPALAQEISLQRAAG